MKEIKYNHYIETTIHSADLIIKNLKTALKNKISTLDMGITGEQFVVLDTIYFYGNIYQQKLSDILMKDKSNTTRIIKILTDKGLITRDLSRVNNRPVCILNITDDGKKLIDTSMPKIKKFITEIFKNISDDEVELLHTFSKKISNDLNNIEKI